MATPHPPSPSLKLATYRAKRDFARTAEPEEGGRAGRGLFVVQHHWARREHFDVRLEIGGVLVSFAVAKGPSLDPSVRRLAVRTEDHPIAYATFEGTIPKGEYGGGTVMLWDRGTFTARSRDPQADLEKGELKVTLHGERTRGDFVLVRMNVEGGRENWLLIKEKDAFADRAGPDLAGRFDRSVASGRTREEIEAAETPQSFARERAIAAGDAPLTRRPPPDHVPPMLCTEAEAAPEGGDWVHEMKYDGYRIQAAVSGETVRLYSREGLDWTRRFPVLRDALATLDLDGASIDGEAVVFDEKGLTDFPALVAALDAPDPRVAYVAFDLLSHAGEDLRDRPLVERKTRLAAVLAGADGRTVRVSGHVAGRGPEVFQAAVAGGAEGIVSKKAASTYRSARSTAWVKVKGERRTDVVVVGYLPSDKRPFRSLHCAVEEPEGLRYVGGVGTGFSTAEMARTRARLDGIAREGPSGEISGAEKAPRPLIWVEPAHRIEVAIGGWTGEGHLRQARFLGWREDRAPRVPVRAAVPARAAAPRSRATPKRADGATADVAADPGALLERITHPDRVMFPETGLTKLGIARHLLACADRLLPHLAGRPVSFVRAPEGVEAETFFQRHVLPGMKRGIRAVPDPRKRNANYLAIEGIEGLVTAAQFGVVELHGWMARLPDPTRPDRMVFDFDPDEGLGFAAVKDAALTLREILAGVGLVSFAMASGGKGLHVVVPLDATQDFDALGDFSGGLAKGLARAEPKRFVAVASKARRHGRIFVDWLRNRPHATAVLPWSLRARPRASVAMPLAWEEVPDLAAADVFDVEAAAARPDPWADFFRIRQRIAPEALDFLKRTTR